MTDDPGRRLPARRPPSEPVPSRSADRFTAPRQTRAISGLTPERAARIVRQSGDARWIAFLGVVIVALFVILYYFYELGVAPLGVPARQAIESDNQQVTAITRGYNLYEANCARCHGPNGEGGVGPLLNDQMKLFSHLNEGYLRNVLTAGGRYVCGNPNSQMPVWADTNGGPLNYIQIEDLIAFLRAPNNRDFVQRDHELNEPVLDAQGKVVTFKGWRDPNFKPDPAASAVPDCWTGTGGPAPSSSIDPNAPQVTIIATTAEDFDTPAVSAPADEAFTLIFDNQDPAAPHNVVVNNPDGDVVDIGDNPFFTGPAVRNYNYPALVAGAYPFICQVHPTTMTGTLTVE